MTKALNLLGAAMNWQAALAWVQTKNSAKYLGYSDWRLPNAKELQSLVDYTRSPDTTNSAAINALFTCTSIINEGGKGDYPWYWAGTTHLDNMGGVYLAFGRALGYMQLAGSSYFTLLDVHGAGAQRSDPKSGSVTNYYLGTDASGKSVYGLGPQGDVIRIANYVRLVRDAGSTTPQQVATPTFTPAAGSYSGSVSVTLASATTGAAIRYTTNGSTPTATSTLYSSPFTVSATATVKAYATKTGMTDSTVASAAYTITAATVATPTFAPAAGSYTGSISVTLASATTGAAIRYTTNGTTPTATSTLYSAPFTVSATATVKAYATKTGMVDSAVGSAAYTITAATRLPDLLIRTAAETAYTGDNVYNTTAVSQTKTQTVTAPATASYALKIQNDGNAADAFKVTASAGDTAWTVKYYDALTGGTDITSQVTGSAGWTTASLAAVGTKEFRVDITPLATAASGAVKDVLVSVISVADGAKRDVVKATTTALVTTRRPDLLIRTSTETAYTGDNIYNADGTSQTKSLSVASGGKVMYALKVQNDGNVADSIKITGAGDQSWTVHYYDALTGGTDITPQVADPAGNGWVIASLAAGAYKEFRVELTPIPTLTSGATRDLLIKAVSTTDATKVDAVRATTKRPMVRTESTAALDAPSVTKFGNALLIVWKADAASSWVQYAQDADPLAKSATIIPGAPGENGQWCAAVTPPSSGHYRLVTAATVGGVAVTSAVVEVDYLP